MGFLPEWMRSKKIIDVRLNIKPDSISQGPTCYACHRQTVKAGVDYTVGENIIVRARRAPGYRCKHDRLEYLATETLREFYVRAQKVFENKGEMGSARTMISALASLE